MSKRPFSSASTIGQNQEFQNSPKLKKQKLIDSINLLNLKMNSINYKIIEKEVPKCAFTIIDQQQKIIEHLTKITSEILDEQNKENVLSDEEELDEDTSKNEKQFQYEENLSHSKQNDNAKCSTTCPTDSLFDNSFDECVSYLNADSSNLITSSVQIDETKESTTVSPQNNENADSSNLFTSVQIDETKESTTVSALNNEIINSSVIFPTSSILPCKDQNIYLDESFMQNLWKNLRKWKNEKRFFNFSDLSFHNRKHGQFVDVNCMVFSVSFPSEKDISIGCPVYLQVCDGTKLTAPSTFHFTPAHLHDDLFDGKLDYEKIREFVQVIYARDEFAEQAKTIKAGDIIQINNLHTKLFASDTHIFSLRGLLDKTRNPFNRGLKILERKEKSFLIERRTVMLKF